MSSATTDSFLALTPEKVLEAVDAAGLRCNAVCYPLNSFENRVYEVELEDRRRIVAKFYRPGRWSREQILEEHSFLAELVEAEISVCAVSPFANGDTLREVEGIYYALSDRQGGRAPDELSDEDVRRLGMLVGRLHNVGAQRQEVNRLPLSTERYIYLALAAIEEQGSLPTALHARYREAATAIAQMADERLKGVPTHRIHADLHLGNVLYRDGQMRVLDFDDMAVGPAVQDLWLALPGRDAYTLRQREIFLDAYEQFRAFDRSTLRLIEPLRGLRMIRYAGWLARRWHDPAFKLGWPHFGTHEYWQQETEDIEEVLSILRGEATAEEIAMAPELQTAEEAKELTNKDYFWDWEG